FEQLPRHGGTVDLHEGAGVARRHIMDGAGDDFLTRSGLARDEHRYVDTSRFADDVEDLAHPGTLPELDLFADRGRRPALTLPGWALAYPQDFWDDGGEIAMGHGRVEDRTAGKKGEIEIGAAIRPAAEADHGSGIAAVEPQAVDEFRGVVAIEIE